MNNDDLFAAAMAGDANAISKLEMKADKLDRSRRTILHNESWDGNTEHVRFILSKFANKNVLVKLDGMNQTALHFAASYGQTDVVEVLIDAARQAFLAIGSPQNSVTSFQAFIRHANCEGDTALSQAVMQGYVPIVKLLVEADPSDRHIQNREGKTPIYVAAEKGYTRIVDLLCTTCTDLSIDGPGNSTVLHAAINNIHKVKEEDGDLILTIIKAVKRSNTSEVEALFNRTDESGCTCLQLAVKKNYVNTVRLILTEDPAYQHGHVIKKHSLMCLIYDAIDMGFQDIVKLLSETYEAGMAIGYKGMLSLILAIKRRDKAFVLRRLFDNIHLVCYSDDEGWTLFHYAVHQEVVLLFDFFIAAEKYAGNQFSYGDGVSTPLHVAAENGKTSALIRLMQLCRSSACTKIFTAVNKDGQNILHLAAAQNEKEMVQGILENCPEQYRDVIMKQQDNNSNTPVHLLFSIGCFVPDLIKHKGLDTVLRNKENMTSRDMLYVQDEIIADQVQIKVALDKVQKVKTWKFWDKSMEMKTDVLGSSLLLSKREAKDAKFKRMITDESNLQLEKYKKRTNTQIIVTALITTVTFTVGFTIPGGLRQSGEADEGSVILSKEMAFKTFMITDALALLMSTCSLFLYFLESMYDDPLLVSQLSATSVGLNIVSIVTMMVTFITGTYVVLSHRPALAISVCFIGCFFFIFVFVLLFKFIYDHQAKENID